MSKTFEPLPIAFSIVAKPAGPTCNGECPKNRFPHSMDKEHGVNYLCPGLTMFFRHISPYMNFMAQEFRENRPPMNVMQWKQAPWKNN